MDDPRPGGSEVGGDAGDGVWSVDDVRHRLEVAGRALMALPLPKGGLPGGARSRWPEFARRAEDHFAALVGASDDIKQDFAEDRHRLRLPPSARAVAQLDEALTWLWHLSDPRKRRLCLARALIHPVSGRHVASYRQLGKLFGLHHDTVRLWHDRALGEIARVLTREGAPKRRSRARRM